MQRLVSLLKEIGPFLSTSLFLAHLPVTSFAAFRRGFLFLDLFVSRTPGGGWCSGELFRNALFMYKIRISVSEPDFVLRQLTFGTQKVFSYPETPPPTDQVLSQQPDQSWSGLVIMLSNYGGGYVSAYRLSRSIRYFRRILFGYVK